MPTYSLVNFLVSMCLTVLYMFIWHRHFDIHLTLVFVLVPVINLSYVFLESSRTLGEALNAQRMTYIGGCFLQLMIMLAIFSLCDIRLSRPLKALFMVLSTASFILALTMGQSPFFYADVSFDEATRVLHKTYGPLHTVVMVLEVLYFLMGIAAILYAFMRRNQVSRKTLTLLLLPQAICMFAYFGGRSLFPNIELLPAAYTLSQLIYLVLVFRLALYDVSEAAINSMVKAGDTGFITFDRRNHYLGSNETARRIFPELNGIKVDFSLRHSFAMKELLQPLLERESDAANSMLVEKNGRFYQLTVTPLSGKRKPWGQEIIITDDTKDMLHIHELNAEVDRKTAHIREMHDQLILSMATMVESRDNSTGGHIRRTSEGVRILIHEIEEAPYWKLTPSFRERLIKAAPMHDLGKIAVDDSILRKPGRFTPEEFEIMKKHAPEGARIVREILKNTDDEEFKVIAENVAHYHHERWDGSGYPDKLKGEEIPLEARIMAIADVWDALVSKRIYKDKMPFEKADAIMTEGMGSQFDPSLERIYRAALPHLEAYYQSLDAQEA